MVESKWAPDSASDAVRHSFNVIGQMLSYGSKPQQSLCKRTMAGLQINRQRVDARPERRTSRRGRQRGLRLLAEIV